MGERRHRNPELDEAPLPKPAEAGPSKRVLLKQSDFDAHGLERFRERLKAATIRLAS